MFIPTTPINISHKSLVRSDYGLRQYQIDAKNMIYSSWEEINNVMFQMPTGTGKTVLFASIINDLDVQFRVKGGRPIRILIIAHREELIDQISSHLNKRGVRHGIIKGGRKKDYSLPVQVGSIQTVTTKSREKEIKELAFDYVIVDEAHHCMADSYLKLWNYFPRSKKLGVTATPYRLDGEGFTNIFDKLILSWPIKKFIEEGFLSPYLYYSVKSDSYERRAVSGITKFTAGDYNVADMAAHMDVGRIRANLYEAYSKYANGKKGIIYAINVDHSLHICEEYEKHGVRAVSIDAKTPSGERRQLVSDFRSGDIDVIVNVDIFSEGFDCPDIEFIQLARPTKSLSKYLQQVGRGLRPTENKTNCIILDNVGMYENFGLPDANRWWQHHFEGKDTESEAKHNSIHNDLGDKKRNIVEGDEMMLLIQGGAEDENIEEPQELPNDEKLNHQVEFPIGFPFFEEEASPIPDITNFEEYIRAICLPVRYAVILMGDTLYEIYPRYDGKFVINSIDYSEFELSLMDFVDEREQYWEDQNLYKCVAIIDYEEKDLRLYESLVRQDFSNIKFSDDENQLSIYYGDEENVQTYDCCGHISKDDKKAILKQAELDNNGKAWPMMYITVSGPIGLKFCEFKYHTFTNDEVRVAFKIDTDLGMFLFPQGRRNHERRLLVAVNGYVYGYDIKDKHNIHRFSYDGILCDEFSLSDPEVIERTITLHNSYALCDKEFNVSRSRKTEQWKRIKPLIYKENYTRAMQSQNLPLIEVAQHKVVAEHENAIDPDAIVIRELKDVGRVLAKYRAKNIPITDDFILSVSETIQRSYLQRYFIEQCKIHNRNLIINTKRKMVGRKRKK